jgi:hypothetical protein
MKKFEQLGLREGVKETLIKLASSIAVKEKTHTRNLHRKIRKHNVTTNPKEWMSRYCTTSRSTITKKSPKRKFSFPFQIKRLKELT